MNKKTSLKDIAQRVVVPTELVSYPHKLNEKMGIYSRSLLFRMMLIGSTLLMSSCHLNTDQHTGKVDSASQRLSVESGSRNAGQKAKKNEAIPDTIDISAYKREIPPFKIRLVNGQGYTYKDLAKNKALILVYFQPDCPECQAFTAALVKRLPALMDRQIVMITFEDLKAVKAFDKKYQVSEHPNVQIGSEGYTFIVQKYYQIEHFPIVACFDNAGKLKRIINPRLSPSAMAAAL